MSVPDSAGTISRAYMPHVLFYSSNTKKHCFIRSAVYNKLNIRILGFSDSSAYRHIYFTLPKCCFIYFWQNIAVGQFFIQRWYTNQGFCEHVIQTEVILRKFPLPRPRIGVEQCLGMIFFLDNSHVSLAECRPSLVCEMVLASHCLPSC